MQRGGRYPESGDEQDKIDYLRQLLAHQVQMYNQEEEQCAFLTSLLMRSHFKSIAESAFHSAFKKKNVHPDELGKASDHVKGKTRLEMFQEKKEKGSLKRKLQEVKATGLLGTSGSSGLSSELAARCDKQKDQQAKKAAQNKKAKQNRGTTEKHKDVGKEVESKQSAPLSAPSLNKPSNRAGEAARLLGEQLLQKLASSASSSVQDPLVNVQTTKAIDSSEHVPSNLPKNQKE